MALEARMLTREFVRDGRVERFVITRAPLGWDVRQEQDNTVVKQSHYSDWHQVERVVRTFERLRNEPHVEPRES
jgi:hypothetical protein